MSLDVYLSDSDATRYRASRIFIRENGQTREISREEWDARYPGREPCVCPADEEPTSEVYSGNVTHNLGKMALEASIYDCLWCPEETGVTTASQLIAPLEAGLSLLLAEPDRFKALNPTNGWGTYDGFVRFVREYLDACKTYPRASIHVSK